MIDLVLSAVGARRKAVFFQNAVGLPSSPVAVLACVPILADGVAVRRTDSARWTQEELAERAGLSARYVGGIERADVSASVTVLGRIADALEVEAHELVRAAPANARKKAAVGP